ncbi:adenine deaminase, partial [Methanosarcinales archaeon]
VMNFPGVIGDDPEVIEKIEIARGYSKLVDGHAPMLGGEELRKYAGFGISTDHECTTEAEALEKIGAGMMIQIREGSAARNFDDLISIIDEHQESCMFCSDDKHPDDLLAGHIRDLVKRAVNYGVDVMKVLQVASLNPVLHYGLDVGMLRAGDPADFLVIDNLDDFNVLKTYIDGNLVADGKRTLVPRRSSKIVNNFKAREKRVEEFALPYTGKTGIERMNVIEAIENQIITEKTTATPTVVDGYVVSDTERDILKIAVLNRYEDKRPAIGFVKNFNLREGAIASRVAHDSQNIIAVGATDEEICRAVNLVIRESGGISAVSRETEAVLPLPIAGIMSNEDYATVAEKYTRIDRIAKELGSTLHAPFMALSFMALLVIPKLKLSDKGLFDVEKFEFVDLFE